MNQSLAPSGSAWEEVLRRRIRPNTLVVGIGNTLRSDDGIGPMVAARAKAEANLASVDCGTTPENSLFRILSRKPTCVVIVDAVDFHGEPGEARIIEPEGLRHSDFSTHAVSPRLFASAIQQETQADCFFMAVQPVSMAWGEGLSPVVARTADRIVEVLAQALTGQG